MILNKRNGEKSDIEIRYADNFFKRFCGLMLKKDIDYGVIFKDLTGSSVHTHFMRFDIDVYFLDENKMIFEKATLHPWKFYKPIKKADFILETKKDHLKLNVGDCLKFS